MAYTRWMNDFSQDLKYGARALVKSPIFALVAILAMALGIGANTAIFSFANLLLVKPVALPDLERLVAVSERDALHGGASRVSPANYFDIKAQSTALGRMAAYRSWSTAITGTGDPVEVEGVRATADFFDTLGVKPALGRGMTRDEEQPGKNFVVVLSDAFWNRQFASNPNVVGKPLEFEGQMYTIIGVMPSNFKFPPGNVDLWAPLAMSPAERNVRDAGSLIVVGLLKPGISSGQARAEVEAVWNHLQQEHPETNANRSVEVLPLTERLVDENSRQCVILMLGVVAFVLLIACANVANLQLARAIGRSTELAVRAALGATRWRLARQFLTESLLIAIGGLIVGLGFGFAGIAVLRVTLPPQVGQMSDVSSLHLDLRTFLFAFLAAVVAGVLSGVAPAWQHSGANLNNTLKEETRGTSAGSGHKRLRNALVVAEVSLALVLLIGAGLMIKGFALIAADHPGLEPQELLTFQTSLAKSDYPQSFQVISYYEQALQKANATPGVRSAAAASGLPYSFYEDPVRLILEDKAYLRANELPEVMEESVSDGYFSTIGIPLITGRFFDKSDGASSAPVAIVSKSMAQRLWPGQDAIGKHLKFSNKNSDNPWLVVIGVVGDIRHEVYDRSMRSILYLPFQQCPSLAMGFAIRTTGDPMKLVGAVRFSFQQINRDQQLRQLESMDTKITEQASALRYLASVMGVFGAIALVLCAVGVYGIISQTVNERQHEIGIRMALGAQRSHVLMNIIGRALLLASIGVVLGLGAASLLARVLAGMIYGVNSWDPATFIDIPLLLTAIALMACYFPARRATRIQPISALRSR